MDKTKEPLVSICCITYNHEKYIKDAIEGFLMQKTDFPFEIIIHDDASTDNTADIIKMYEKKYPELIKPIYQVENQYSKGVKVTLLVFKKAKGKYIALCEGDDYWTDPLKLQKQITEMEKHPECHISFHPAIVKWMDGSKEDKIMGLHSNESKKFPIEDVISGGGVFMPTNSIVINKLAVPRIISFFEIAKDAPIGDYYLQILGAENGGALYINELMSVYRQGVSGSFSEKFESSFECGTSLIDSLIATHNKIDEFTNYKYTKQFNKHKRCMISPILKSTNIGLNVRKNLFESYNEYINLKDKFFWHIMYKNPRRYKYIYIKDKLLWHLIFKHPKIKKVLKGL
jgi:glycosyltransferase involved in cell wall biosynthesis